jgi:hypothetical protein
MKLRRKSEQKMDLDEWYQVEQKAGAEYLPE